MIVYVVKRNTIRIKGLTTDDEGNVRLIVAGGTNHLDSAKGIIVWKNLNTTEIYDFETDAWSFGEDLPQSIHTF